MVETVPSDRLDVNDGGRFSVVITSIRRLFDRPPVVRSFISPTFSTLGPRSHCAHIDSRAPGPKRRELGPSNRRRVRHLLPHGRRALPHLRREGPARAPPGLQATKSLSATSFQQGKGEITFTLVLALRSRGRESRKTTSSPSSRRCAAVAAESRSSLRGKRHQDVGRSQG